MEIVKTILLFASLLGFFFSINLFLASSYKNQNWAKFFLALYLLFISLIVLDIWEAVNFSTKSLYVLDAYGFIGPSIYFLIIFVIQPSYKLNPKEKLLFLPGVLEVFLQICRIVDYKVFQTFIVLDEYYFWSLEILEILSFLIAVGLMIKLANMLWNKKHHQYPKWINVFYAVNVGLVIIWSVMGIFRLVDAHSISFLTLALGIALYIGILASFLIRSPRVLTILSNINKRKLKTQENPNAQKDLAIIQEVVEKEKLYINSNFNLKDLSRAVNLPKDYVSEILNHQLGKSFRVYINELRIEQAKLLLTDNKNAHLSMLGIAYEAGFKSESTFYTAFKKVTGTTPRQFRTNN